MVLSSRVIATGALLFVVTACAAKRSSSAEPRAGTETISIRVSEGPRLGFDLSPDGRRLVFDRWTLDTKVNWMASEKVNVFGRFSVLDFVTENASVGLDGGWRAFIAIGRLFR